MFESVYEELLGRYLAQEGLRVERQVPIDFVYRGLEFKRGFCVDLLVERCVVVEIKSIERTAPVHPKQVLTYLRLMDLKVGLLMNFGCAQMRDGIQRIVNTWQRPIESPSPPHPPRLRVK